MNQSFDVLLDHARMVLENVQSHPQVKAKMAEFGYHQQRLQEGKALYETVVMLQTEQEDHYSKEKGISLRLREDLETAKALYKEHMEIARFAFRNDPEMEKKLELKGARKQGQVQLSKQMHRFYEQTEPIIPVLKKYGAQPEEFAQAKAMVEAIIAACSQRMRCQGNAQEATQKRNMVVKELRTWLTDFRKVARVALKKESQLLESFGIQIPAIH